MLRYSFEVLIIFNAIYFLETREKVVSAAYHRTNNNEELLRLKSSIGTGTSIWIDHEYI